MKDCTATDCDDTADLEIQIAGEPNARAYCLNHGQQERQKLDSLLVSHQVTSLVQTDPSESHLLAASYGQLEQVHTENIGLRKAVEQARRDWNEADQARQAVTVDRDRKAALVQELSTQLIEASAALDQVKAQLAAANELLDLHGITAGDGTTDERVQGGKVEPLTGVGAGSDPNGPTS